MKYPTELEVKNAPISEINRWFRALPPPSNEDQVKIMVSIEARHYNIQTA